MKKLIYSLLICLLLPATNYGQSNDEYWRLLEVNPQNFTAITDSFELYIADEYPDSIPQSKLANIKDYYRFVNHWKSRIGIINDTLSYLPYTEAALANLLDPYCDVSDPADWDLLGPKSYSTQWLGLVEEVIADPRNDDSYILSAENGGLWKSRSTGNSWENVTDDLYMPGIAATEIIRHPVDQDTLFASTGAGWHEVQYGMGIIQSFDNGETWEIMEDFPYETCPYVKKVIYDPYDDPSDGLDLWAITQTNSSGKIYFSDDAGESWTEVTGPTGMPNYARYHDIEIAKQGSNIIVFVSTKDRYANLNGGVYKYVNGTWSDLSSSFDSNITYKSAKITTPDDGTIFVMLDYCDGNNWDSRQIYRTTDYGSNWQGVRSLDNGRLNDPNKDEIEYSALSNIVYIGSVDVCMFRNTSPYNLTHIVLNPSTNETHVDIRDIEIIGYDIVSEEVFENILLATDGGISLFTVEISDEDLESYTLEDLNGNHLPIGNFMGLGASHSDDEFIVAGAVHNGSWKYENEQWTKFYGGDGGDSEVNWDDQDYYYYQSNSAMLGASGVYPRLLYNTENWFIGMEYELGPNDPYTVYFGRTNKLVIWDQNNGQYVERQPPSSVKSVGAIGINNDNSIFIADYRFGGPTESNRFNKSTNDGVNWTDMSSKPVYEYVNGSWVSTEDLDEVIAWRTIEDIVFNPDDPDEMWISIGGVHYENGEPVGGKLKVLHSTDLGENWYDYSENLPPFPVMTLEYQLGSNKRLFAGTDAGVYYRDNSMSQWSCFNDGLPICLVSDLDYDPCNKELYAATQGRAIFKTDVSFIDTVITYLDSSQVIEWDTPREIANDLVIPATTTLTISSNLFLSEDVKIIIMPGGKLEIDGGLLTNQCGDTWQGIEVWGNPSATQSAANQGTLEIINGGTIKNAAVAVHVGKEGNTNFGGGIVDATNGNFNDNAIGVWFDPYSYTTTNASGFTNCKFDYSLTLNGEATFTHVKLNDVHHVAFAECEFANNSNADHRGYGIYSTSAIFSVEGTCATYSGTDCVEWDISQFENLDYGIYATASNTTDLADVRHTTFTDNHHGIYLSGMTLPRITSNEFYIEKSAALDGYGLYLDACTQYWVEDNHFEGSGLSKPIGIGVYVNESGEDANEIYLNSFDYVEYAVIVKGENRKVTRPQTGLQILCNYYDNTLFDETIIYEGLFNPPTDDGIAPLQGQNSIDVEDMAGNIFYYNTTTSGDYDDINNESNHFYYYYSDDASGYNVEPLDYTTSTVTKVEKDTDIWTYAGGCPPGISTGGGGGTEESRSAMEDAQTEIAATEAVLMALVDGGDTETLNAEVESSTPPEAAQMYNELMAESPNLSETVVESTIEKEDVLPNAMLRDVMVANPHTAASVQLLDKLDDRDNPMPTYMKAQILAGRSITSLKAELEGQLAAHNVRKAKAMNNIARYFGNLPDEPTAYDSLLLLYQADNSLSSHYMQAWLHLQAGEYLLGQNVMAGISSNFTLTVDESAEYQNMLLLYTMLKGLFDAGNNIDDLSEAQIVQLQSMVNAETGFASVYARNILLALDVSDYKEPVILPNTLKSTEAEEAYKEVLNAPAPKMLEVYPNPSKDFVILGYLFDKETQGMIEIRDISGTLMQSIPFNGMQDQITVITRNWNPGIYVLSLVVGDKVIETTKFTLVH